MSEVFTVYVSAASRQTASRRVRPTPTFGRPAYARLPLFLHAHPVLSRVDGSPPTRGRPALGLLIGPPTLMLGIMDRSGTNVESVALMRRRAAFTTTGGLLCLVAATAANAAHPGPVPPLAGPPLPPRSHGIMLYLSQPMGGGAGGAAAAHPQFGFRVDQVRMMGNSGAPDAGDPLQHRSLIGWQMDGHNGLHASDVRMELGGRVTYDMTRGGFGIQPSRSGSASSPARPMAVAATTPHAAPSGGESKSFELHGLEFRGADSAGADFRGHDDNARPFTRDLFHEANGSASMLHEVAAAAIATFKSSRTVPAQQRSRLSERP